MGLSAPVASAQQLFNAPVSTTSNPSASSNDPTLASRSARYLLRNGVDYVAYKQFAKALRFLRAAESRQGELDDGERKDLRVALDGAQRGLRESGDVATRNRSRRPGAMTTAAPLADPSAVQLVEVSQSVPVAAPDPRPVSASPTVREPAVVRTSATSATSAAPIELPEPPGALPEPSAAPTPALVELPTPAPAPSAAPVPSGIELPPLPGEVSGPAPAPSPLPESKLTTTETLPAPALAATAPAVINLEPLPEAPNPTTPTPGPAPAPAPVAAPAELPVPAPEPVPASKPEEVAARPETPVTPPVPDATPASIPVASEPPPVPVSEASPISPAASSALKRLRQERAAVVPPVDDRPASPEPVPLPVAVPAVERRRPTPEPAPAAAADELPPLPGAASDASLRSAASPRGDDPSTRDMGRPLSPALEAEIARIAQRMTDESRAPAAAQPSQLPAFPGTPPSNTLPPGDDMAGMGGGGSSTRFELTRAPSPTEAWPIRKIPVPEEFVPVPARDWSPNRKYWQAPALCHMPLYFQDAALERYGHSVEQFVGPAGRYLSYPVDSPRQSKQRYYILQPIFSAGLFAAQIVALPYNLIVDPPGEAEYDLGYYRPGDRIPTDTYYLPLTGVGPPLRGRNY